MYSIVYKTYRNDLDWLKYSLLSVDKFITDSNYEIVIYYHNECEKDLKDMISDIVLKNNYRLIPVEYDINGYLKQMVVKCLCFNDIQSDYILIMDCDVIFNNYFSYKDMFSKDDRINWYYLKRTIENNNDDQWVVWQESVFNMTNDEMNVFYMYNGFPFLFKRETLKLANDKFLELNGLDYNEFCKINLKNKNVGINDSITGNNGKFRIMSTIFEEFEYLGWFSNKFTNSYNFIEGVNKVNVRRQFWSHGGLNDSIINEIENIIK